MQIQLSPEAAAWLTYANALTAKAVRCQALQVTTECEQCGLKAELRRYAKRDGRRINLCGACLRGVK